MLLEFRPGSSRWLPRDARNHRALKILAAMTTAAAALGGTALIAVPAASAQSTQSVPCSGTGGGSDGLIAAITTANSQGGGTIDLALNCTYALTSSNNGTNGSPMSGATGENGLPVITTPISIIGSSSTIQANHSGFRIFEVNAPNGNLTLQGVTLTGGSSVFGGALFNDGGTVTLSQDVITGNIAQMAGGGLATGTLAPNQTAPVGTLSLNSTTVSGNNVKGSSTGGGGGGIVNHGGTLNLSNSQVDSNTSAGGGGGIASGPGGGPVGNSVLNITNSQVAGNTETGGPMSGGGGIANGGMATISGTQISGNSAPGSAGGGILNHGTMKLSSSNVVHNIAGTDQSGNAGNGGGIANLNLGSVGATAAGVLSITQTQIDNNQADGSGGAIIEGGINASGIPLLAGYALNLSGSQVEGNVSGAGGAISATLGSSVTFSNTAVGSNSNTACPGATGNAAWLCQAYWDILSRPPDSAGSSHFQSMLSSGTSRTQVASDLLSSKEYWSDNVFYFYELALGRQPDAAGMAKWVSQLSSGARDQNVLAALFGSKEFYADAGSTSSGFLAALYNNLLGRAPDSAGLSSWQSKLAAGESRTAVALAIITSHEWLTSLFNTSYLNLLDRPVDPTGLSTGINKLLSGVSYETIEAGTYGSPEFFKVNG